MTNPPYQNSSLALVRGIGKDCGKKIIKAVVIKSD
jgi:hypothetical protein